MNRIIDTRTFWVAVAVAFMTLAAASCAKVSGGTSPPPTAEDTSGVTNVAPSAGATPAVPSTVANVGAPQVALPAASSAAQSPSPAPQEEVQATPPSPAVLEAVGATQRKLDALTAVLDGTHVRFVDCGETSACTARLEASSLAGLRDLLQSVSAQQGGIAFVAREQLDGFAGRSFVADVTMGGAEARPVPTDETELLAH